MPRYFGHDITNQQITNNSNKTSNVTKKETKQRKETFVLKTDHKLSAVDFALKNDELYTKHYINEQMDDLFESEYNIKDYINININNNKISNNEFIITEKHRSLIINHIVLLNYLFELYDSTLFCATKIIDQYLSSQNGKLFSDKRISNNFKSEMLLISCCALWISSKYNEIYPPQIDDFLEIKQNNFTQKDLISMEAQILLSINFNLTVPNSLIFIQRFYEFGCFYIDQNPKISTKKKKENQKNILYSLMKYCGEICFMNYDLSLYKPSKIAASILYYCLIGTGIISKSTQIKNDGFLKYINNYKMNQLLNIIQKIHKIAICIEKSSKSSLIYKKYSNVNAYSVTKIPSKMYRSSRKK